METETTDRFEDLEKTSLLFDILIDCEEYVEFDKALNNLQGISHSFTTHPIDETINETSIRAKISEIEDVTLKDYIGLHYFKIVFSSKYVRRLLKENEREIEPKTSDVYKTLAEALLRKLPPRSAEQSKGKNRQNQFRIIVLNEISAASEGNLAIGYADMALEELKQLDANWNVKDAAAKGIKHPYELYALYNKGLAFLHHHVARDIEKAIDTFTQILGSFTSGENRNPEAVKVRLRDKFYTEYADHTKLYGIFFWLIYIPTQHLNAEAHADLNSSHNLEAIISEALTNIETEKATFGDQKDADSGETIQDYHRYFFALQLIQSKIDSGNFEKGEQFNAEMQWIEAFTRKSGITQNVLDYLPKRANKCKRIIDSKLHTAEAIFWLEYAKGSRRQAKECFRKSFELCVKRVNDKDIPTTDQVDFAVTFLDCILFALKDQHEIWDHLVASGDRPDLVDRFDETYEKVFEMLKKEEWRPRKKELVEKFLDCQEELLQKAERSPASGWHGNFVRYQIELLKIVLDDDRNKQLQKKWPEWEKVKLWNSLRNAVDTIGDCELKHRLREINARGINNLPDQRSLEELADFISSKISCDFYTKKLRLNSEHFFDHLIYKSCKSKLVGCFALTVLRRWQSFTPALSMGSEVGQKGGGYFVYKTDEKGEIDEGLVVDPGFDFLENFFDEGFSIRDISAILMTHSHRDHSSDFMSIITLVHEMNKRGKRVFRDGKWAEKKLVLFMTDGSFFKFEEEINNPNIRDAFRDVVRIKKDEEYGENTFLNIFRIRVTKAIHNDLTDYDSVGFIITDRIGANLIGFTGDTQWFNGIEEIYKDCPIVCMNIGGVVDIFKKGNIMLSDLSKESSQCFDNIRNILISENHLYFPGFYLVAKGLSKSKQKLLIISELCEELKGGLRTDLAERICGEIGIPVLPEDIGLTVRADESHAGHVLCKACQSFHEPQEIIPIETVKENATTYLCKRHYNELRENHYLPRISELELDVNELRKPLKQKNN